MARRRVQTDDDDAGGLDSLLDTMTNVVGILVLVLIATQLGVQQAVTKAVDIDKLVSEEDLEEKRKELALSEEQKKMILAQLENKEPDNSKEVEIKVADLRRKAEENRRKLDEEKKTANTFAMKIAQDEKLAEEARKKIKEMKDSEENRKKLADEITSMLEKEATLKATLDDTPVQKAPPAKVVTLPDPKPAPEGAKRLTFFCVRNKVYPIQEDLYRDPIKQQCEALCDGIVQNGIVDKEKFFQRVKRIQKNWKDDHCDIEVVAAGIYLNLRFIPRDNDRAGASVNEVEKPNSKFRRSLGQVDNRAFYAKFFVYSDSYDVYLSARAALAKQNLLAGWEPRKLPADDAPVYYDTSLRSKILFGEKPPPKPVDPNAPKPKPRNEID